MNNIQNCQCLLLHRGSICIVLVQLNNITINLNQVIVSPRIYNPVFLFFIQRIRENESLKILENPAARLDKLSTPSSTSLSGFLWRISDPFSTESSTPRSSLAVPEVSSHCSWPFLGNHSSLQEKLGHNSCWKKLEVISRKISGYH